MMRSDAGLSSLRGRRGRSTKSDAGSNHKRETSLEKHEFRGSGRAMRSKESELSDRSRGEEEGPFSRYVAACVDSEEAMKRNRLGGRGWRDTRQSDGERDSYHHRLLPGRSPTSSSFTTSAKPPSLSPLNPVFSVPVGS